MSVDTLPNNISNSESTTIHLEYSAAQSPIIQEKCSSLSNESHPETQYVSQTELLSPGSSNSLFFDQSSPFSKANVTQLCVDANSLILHEDSEQEEVIEDLNLDNTIMQAEEQKHDLESDARPFVSTGINILSICTCSKFPHILRSPNSNIWYHSHAKATVH